MNQLMDLVGQQFGRLTVISETDKRLIGKNTWRRCFVCRCDCGNEVTVPMSDLRSGAIQSCKCFMRERIKETQITHGQTKSKLHRAWKTMRQRCLNPNNPKYHRYGGRGIKICERWNSFENFMEDVGQPPIGLDLYRINNDEDFSPSNFRWSSATQESEIRKISPEAPKVCCKCLQLKPIDQFHRKYRDRYRRRSRCKSCARQHRLDNHAVIVEKERIRRDANRDKLKKSNRVYHLRLNYGLSVEQYNKLLTSQNGVCAVCREIPDSDKPLFVDHCHVANHVRGLLCGNCNTAEGLIRTATNAARLLSYMEKNELFEKA